MKVLFYLDMYSGGSARVVETILRNTKLKPVIVLNNEGLDFNTYNSKVINIKNHHNFIINFIYRIIQLRKIIQIEKPEVVFSMLTSPNITSLLVKKIFKLNYKCVINENTCLSRDLALFKGLKSSSSKFLVKKFYNKSNKIIVVSESMKNDLIENFKVKENKIFVLYNPIDINEIEKKSKEKIEENMFEKKTKTIISLGRLSKEKGFDFLIKAFNLVQKEEKNIQLAIIGTGPEKENLQNLINVLKIEDKVKILPFNSNPYPYLKKSNLFVSSSLYEGFGLAIAEAMVLNVPVIASRCNAGPEEILGEDYEFLCEPENISDLSDKILKLINNESLRRKIAERNRKRVELFSSEKIVKKYVDLIES